MLVQPDAQSLASGTAAYRERFCTRAIEKVGHGKER